MEKSLLKVCAKQKVKRTPIWFMRQAGRYLPEFHQVKKQYNSFFDVCMDPKAVLEITMQPIKRFDLDAAILFSDILIVPLLMAAKVTFTATGPEVDMSKKHIVDKDKILDAVSTSLQLIKQELHLNYPHISLIGFAGAPWTVACYMVEGKLSKDFHKVKAMSYNNRLGFSELISKITEVTIEYLKMQVNSGAEVIKIFDSWAGVLTREEFITWVIQPTIKIVKALKAEFPDLKIIGFPRHAGFLYEEYTNATGVDIVALDQYVPLEWAKKHLSSVILQGNLDNILLASSKEQAALAAKEIVKIMKPGHFIFNLGHGIIPNTPIENIEAVIKAIREVE